MEGGPRLAFVVAAGALVVVLLTGGLASAAARGGVPWSSDDGVHAAADSISPLAQEPGSAPASTVAAAPPSPSADAAVPPSSTTSRPATTVATRAPRSPSTAPAPSGGPVTRSGRTGYGPYPDYAVDVPFSPGQTTWSGVSNGVSITVRSDTARPKAGDIIPFRVEVSSPTHACCGVRMLFGDGVVFDDQDDRCSGAPGTTARFETRHAYNLDGRWTFNVSGFAGGCGGAPVIDGELFGTIEVAAGVTTAQGPFPPKVLVDSSVQPKGHEDDYSWLSLAGMVDDDDGWMRRIIVDWGDGSPPTVVPQHPDVECRPHAVTGWPSSSKQVIFTGQVVHHYATAGTYTVTIVGVSTACDGVSEVQQAGRTLRWQAPASG